MGALRLGGCWVWWGVEGKEIESYDDTSAALLVELQDDHPVKEINLHGFHLAS